MVSLMHEQCVCITLITKTYESIEDRKNTYQVYLLLQVASWVRRTAAGKPNLQAELIKREEANIRRTYL